MYASIQRTVCIQNYLGSPGGIYAKENSGKFQPRILLLEGFRCFYAVLKWQKSNQESSELPWSYPQRLPNITRADANFNMTLVTASVAS